MSGFVAGTPPHQATIQTVANTATATLNADGTVSIANVTCTGSQLTQGAWTLTPVDCAAGLRIDTWTYADGILTVRAQEASEGFQFSVGLGGRLGITAIAPFHPQDPSSDAVLLILTRLH